ncbi:copper amine oxidase N-terminal domain-containing protein [Ureibacillus sp. GCM10028918]|uniref:copper amine oxidase N-terminal domain-containing protein n=1 Tax=Ureibacillus sp. GCM10028918 TaxID=3273429 RepID=UPI0036076263
MMFRILFVSLVGFIAFFSILSNEASAANASPIMKGITIELNGETITFDDPVLNKSGYVLLPMRDFYEAIGATVSWDKASLTASSYKNGHTVELTINSTNAKVDGESVLVPVAAMMYKDRTYIPLRFVSENLDGTVAWDQSQRKVTIELNDSQETPDTPDTPVEIPPVQHIIHMNDSKILMDEPIITRGGRTYIPAKYFEYYLENGYGAWLSKEEYELLVADTLFTFSIGSNTVYVDGQSMEMAEKPFMEYGEIYVPVHFIVNSLTNSGRIQYDRTKQELYISINDYIFSGEKLDLSYGILNVPQLVPSAALEGKRELIVSDNPEYLSPTHITGDTATLAEYKVDAQNAEKEYSIFGWHLNHLGTKANIGITIENISDANTLEITKAQGISKVGSDNSIKYDIGLPLADNFLSGNLKNAEGNGIKIAPGETKLIQSYLLDEEKALGFLNNIDVRSLNGANSKYIIRVVLSKNDGEDLTSIHSDVVSLYDKHPRGVWPSSTISTTLPTYTVGTKQTGYNISNGKTDNLLTAENSLTKMNGTIGNPGHFGMTYKVNVPVSNPNEEEQTIKISLAGRGGSYSGAVKYDGTVYLIPTITPGVNYVQLPEHVIGAGKEEIIQLEIMHAGGGNLPVAVYVETE